MLGYELFILLIAGIGAGIVTGLLGASAVTIAAPLMIIFLGYDAFTSIGISLAIDVFASAVTAYVFYKNKNIKIKPINLLIIFSVIGAFIGSYFSSYFPTGLLSKFIGFFVMLTGFNLMRRGLKGEIKFFKELFEFRSNNFRRGILIIAGLIVGLIAGIFGGGGGVTLLLLLTLLLNYKIHPAIGTSVFIMMFIAFSGAVGHILYGSFLVYPFLIASIGGIIGAYFTATKTNATSEEKLNKMIGFIFFILGFFLFLKEIFDFLITLF